MKKIFFILPLILFTSLICPAQKRPMMGQNGKPMQRIEQWEKMKLIEILNLNEETAVRFFSRRHDNQKKIREILDKRENIIKELENHFKNDGQRNDSFYKEQISKLLALESNIAVERENFFKSLSDLFSPVQMAKLLVFESDFRREVRESLMRRGPGPKNRE